MTDALKVLAGDRMKLVLARLTTNRLKAVFAGAFVTSVIQSSSVTTVLVVGFISAGLLSLQQAFRSGSLAGIGAVGVLGAAVKAAGDAAIAAAGRV